MKGGDEGGESGHFYIPHQANKVYMTMRSGKELAVGRGGFWKGGVEENQSDAADRGVKRRDRFAGFFARTAMLRC